MQHKKLYLPSLPADLRAGRARARAPQFLVYRRVAFDGFHLRRHRRAVNLQGASLRVASSWRDLLHGLQSSRRGEPRA